MMRRPIDRASFVHDSIIAAVLITSGAACAQSASSTQPVVAVILPGSESVMGRFDPGCPYIARVCALIADPAVRDYIGLSEYAWDFNAPSEMRTLEAMPPLSPELVIARSNTD